MTTMSPPQPPPTGAPPRSTAARDGKPIRRKLRQAWRKDRRYTHLRGLCLLLMWTAALVLLTLLVDWLLLLPGWARLALLAVHVATLGYVAYRKWWRELERFDVVRMALRVERQHPELASLLVSYVQFEGSPGRVEQSMPLVEAMCEQAIERTRGIDFRQIVDATELRRLGLYCAGVLVVFAVVSAGWPDAMRVFGQRMLNPRAAVTYPTRTQIAHVTGDIVVRQGDPVRLEAIAAGVIPVQGTLLVRTGEARVERMALEADAQSAVRFTHELAQVHDGFDYAFELGDARSAWHSVRVSAPPRVVATRVELDYPDYTLMEDETVDALHLEVPAGTRITWQFELDRSAGDAGLLIDEAGGEAEREAMELEDGGRTLRLERRADASFGYRLWQRWRDGEQAYEREEPVRYFVYAVADNPPVVDLVEPRRDVPGTLRRRLDLAFEARDAYGLSEGWIVYRRNGGEEQRHELGAYDGQAIEETVAWRPGDVVEGLSEGDILEFAVEFADTHDGEDGPNRGRSSTRRLIVMGEAEYLRYIAQERRRLMRDVEAVRDEEAEALDEIGTMRRQTEDRP
ncbi:MAG: DUF4175 family protein [Phycisphaeraceae bacterium]